MTYCFKCERCGDIIDVIRRVRERSIPVRCYCGGKMTRDFQAEHCSVRGDYDNPIVSTSMAFDAIDINEHRRRFPNVEVQLDGRIANPILRNLSQKRNYMKGRGFIDQNAFV